MSKLFKRVHAMVGAHRNEPHDSCRSSFRFYLILILAGLLIFTRPISAFASGTISPTLQYASAITQPTFNVANYTISASTPGGACQWYISQAWTFNLTGEVIALSSSLWNCPRTRGGLTYDTYVGLVTAAVCPAPSGGLPYVWNYKNGLCERPFAYPANATLSGSTYTCNIGYQPDTTGTSCVASAAACPANMSGTPCTCNAGYVPFPYGGCYAPGCPVNMSGIPCACNAGYVTNPGGAGCVPACPTHAHGTPCACDAGYVFNSTNTSCVTLALSVRVSPPIIPASSSVQNKRVLTQSNLALILQKGQEPSNGVTVNLQSNRGSLDTINGPAAPTDTNGNATADISTRHQPGTSVVTASDTVNIKTSSPGIINWFPAEFKTEFSVSCYTLSQEVEFRANPSTRNACGLQGKTYRSGFLADVSVQGSGIGLDGKIIRYQGKKQGKLCFKPDICAHTASTRCAVVGTTIAVDPRVIPLGDSRHPGSHINVQILGSRYAQDVGGDIKGYKIDDYVGAMPRSACKKIGRHPSKVTFLNY